MAKFRFASYYTFRDMNYFLRFFVKSGRQTESDTYEPTVQIAQVGSKRLSRKFNSMAN